MNIARSSFKLFLGKTSSAVVGLIGITVFARELGATSLGAYFLFEALLGILSIPTDFGLSGAVEKRISEGESQGEFLSGALLLKLVPATIAVLVIILSRSYVAEYVGARVSVLLAVALIIQELANISTAVLKGELRVEEIAALRFVRQLTWFVVGWILIAHGFGTLGLVYGLIAGLTVVFIWGWYKISVEIRRPSIWHLKSLINYGKYNFVSSVGGYTYGWMDVALIGVFLTQAHVAAYELAWRISSTTIMFSSAIATSIFPQVSEWSADGAVERIENLMPELLTPSLILVVPAFAGSLLLSEDILRYAFGSEYVIAAIPLVILMFDKITEAAQLVFGRSLQGIDRPDQAAIATIVAVSLNLVLNIILIWHFGIVGAAVATTIASLVGGVGLHAYFLGGSVRIQVPYLELTGIATASGCMVVAIYPLMMIFPPNSIIRVLGFVGLGAVIYGIFILLIPPIRGKLIYHAKEALQ